MIGVFNSQNNSACYHTAKGIQNIAIKYLFTYHNDLPKRDIRNKICNCRKVLLQLACHDYSLFQKCEFSHLV